MSAMTQTGRILALLKRKGSVTNVELNRICFRYAARIHELRKEQHDILSIQEKPGVWRYFYRGQRVS